MHLRLSPKTRRNIERIIPFGIIWFLLGNLFLFIELTAIGDLHKTPSSAIQIDFQIYIFATLAVTAVGLLVGTIEVLYLSNRFTNKSLTQKITIKTIIYGLFLFVIIQITFPIAASLELKTGLLDTRVWDKYLLFLTSKTYLSTNVQLAVELIVSLFYFEISENIGHGIMINFLSGKYHSPKEETRIFMFLDMKSSTTIAENLGHIRYFEFLKAYFQNLSEAIVAYEGEIYQYVGDEVTISWPLKKGLRENNCIQCFYAMRADLEARSSYYSGHFGFQPKFKAGLHYGKVTTGEIGALKKEIIFTGDTLNATARIQSLCNHYDVDILLSEDLVIELSTSSQFQFKSMGKSELRGKALQVELFTIIE